MFRKTAQRALATGASGFMLTIAASAHAQTTVKPTDNDGVQERSATTATAPTAVGEIIVTAQKRAVNLEKLPATVSVVGGAQLKDLEIRSLNQLNTLVPGYNYERSAGGNPVISIRGVGTTSAAQSLEQSVAAYINGVYMGGNLREFVVPLYDIGQVEVLKGTQSGISGQNTSVGALNIVTVMPGDKFGGYLLAGHEFNFDGWNAEGAVNLPVSDALKVRVSGLYDNEGSWIHNIATGAHTGGITSYSGRINAVLRVSNAVDVKLYIQYDKGDSLSGVLVPFGNPPDPAFSAFIPGLQAYGSTNSLYSSRGEDGGNESFHYDNLRSSLTVNLDLGGPVLTSITAASRIHDRLTVDGDVSPLDLNWIEQPTRYSQIHQELRLVSPSGQRLRYILGGWFRYSKQDKTFNDFFDVPLPPPLPILHLTASLPFLQETNTSSVFGDLHYDLTNKLTAGGTLRYTDETKTSVTQAISNFPPGTPFPSAPLTRGKLHFG